MGGCCSTDSTPDCPTVIRADPDFASPLEVVTKALGYWGMSRDFGVWEKEYPSSKEERTEKMWFWFNKCTSGQNTGRIDLETFEGRGEKPEDPKKGKVLYYAMVTEKPFFQSFQRIANTSFDSFYGIYTNGYADEPDSFYVNHPTHMEKKRDGGRALGQGLITKWQLNTKALIYDGEKGRGAMFGQNPIYLEVFSKGTVVTTYQVLIHKCIDMFV